MQSIGSAIFRSLSRRNLLKGAGFGITIFAPAFLGAAKLPSRAAGASSMDMSGQSRETIGVPRASFDRDALLIEPQARRSMNGELRTTLRVAYAYKDIGGYRLSLRTYEGNVPGPTLRLRPGDALRIKLVNELPPNADPGRSI